MDIEKSENEKKLEKANKRKCLLCVAAIFIVLFASVLAFLVFHKSGKKAGEGIVLRLSEVHSDEYPTSLADKEFSRLVYERSGGRIKVEVYTDGRLFSDEPDALAALQAGELDFARISSAPICKFVPVLNVVNLPFLYRDDAHFLNVITGPIGQIFLDSIEKENVGIVGLCFYDSGSRSLYMKKEIHSVEELEGMKIRIQVSPTMNDYLLSCNATGIIGIATHEVYDKILNGIVDGAENNIPTYQTMGDYLAAPYYIKTNHARVPDILVASSSLFEKLPESDVELIKECAMETELFQIKRWAEKEEKSAEIISKAANVVELTDEELSGFREKAKGVYKQYEAEFGDLIEMIKNEEP